MYSYNSSNLKALIRESGLTGLQIAEAAGVNPSTLQNALNPKRQTPSIATLGALADYFAVPLDFIAGRCDEETAKSILADYSRHFMELRRAPFESYLKGKKPEACATYGDGECETPWPYNLLDAVFNKGVYMEELGFHTIVDQDYEDDIMKTLKTIEPREEACILRYFRDGKSTDQIAEENNLTRSRIYQILQQGLRKLRHPSRSKVLRYGSAVAAEMSEIAAKQDELRIEAAKLATLSAKLQEEREALGVTEEEAEALDMLSLSVHDMNLSVRPHNCLTRAGLMTLERVVEYACEGKLSKIRHLGRHSLEEILNKIFELTGEDYHHLYQ